MSDDRERLEDAEHVLHGPEGARLVAKVLYAVYVTALVALVYTFTVLRAVLVTTDAGWLRRALSGWSSVGIGFVTLGLLAWAAWWLGGRRGPATPPLPWVDHVVASGIDRSLTLAPWWRAALVGVSGCSAVLGGAIGAALYAAGLASAVVLPWSVAAGGLLAALLCWLWLVAQGRGDHSDRLALQPKSALRAIALDDLRAHSRRSQRLHGAALAGDPRAARLQVASPIRRGRVLRLRPGGPVVTTVRRDLLGLRRQPGPAVAGLVLAAAGAWLSALTVLDATTPLPVTIAGVGLAHLGVGQWAQGLRFAADGLTASPVFGGSALRVLVLSIAAPVLLVLALGSMALREIPGSGDGWLPVLALMTSGLVLLWRGKVPISRLVGQGR